MQQEVFSLDLRKNLLPVDAGIFLFLEAFKKKQKPDFLDGLNFGPSKARKQKSIFSVGILWSWFHEQH